MDLSLLWFLTLDSQKLLFLALFDVSPEIIQSGWYVLVCQLTSIRMSLISGVCRKHFRIWSVQMMYSCCIRWYRLVLVGIWTQIGSSLNWSLGPLLGFKSPPSPLYHSLSLSLSFLLSFSHSLVVKVPIQYQTIDLDRREIPIHLCLRHSILI